MNLKVLKKAPLIEALEVVGSHHFADCLCYVCPESLHLVYICL